MIRKNQRINLRQCTYIGHSDHMSARKNVEGLEVSMFILLFLLTAVLQSVKKCACHTIREAVVYNSYYNDKIKHRTITVCWMRNLKGLSHQIGSA